MNYKFTIVWIAFVIILNFQSSYNKLIRNGYSQIFQRGINQFSAEFYESLSKNEESNFITSPISVSITAAMASYGADGNTRIELEKALHLPLNRSFILKSFHKFIKNINNVDSIELHLATKLFIKKNFEINKLFSQITQYVFKTVIQSIDFKNTNEAATEINIWCKKYTNNKITNIIKPDDLEQSQLVMVNAVYFKGNWVYPFRNSLEQHRFDLSETNFIHIPMMCNSAIYNYGSILNRTALYIELPYQQTNNSKNKFSMYIIIPNEINGLSAMSDSIHKIDFTKLNNAKDQVDLCMPKFKIESEFDIIPTLENLGIHDMFHDNADFSKLSTEKNLKVTKIIQKAFINVDEKGSEAAATTGFTLGFRSLPFQLDIDKPFIATIVSKTSGTPLFWARVNDPRF